ncbi:TonB-dependent receptor domain-containing protein [Fulvivirga lutea]|uniref:TonB-dependent receptor n=1 Tax=Fulvivirga lutea TaxID=2810512 RepID=A0A975A0L4_9BACT|nr:outer membrane beta-barrel family protein [Fulvivirga lutea]QSE96926.1 TonB-dependent receptor [Fulvivirga lutea]
MRKSIILAIVYFLCFNAAAQSSTTYELSGRVIDGTTNSGLEFSTVSLLNISDSSLIDGVITDSEGRFQLKTKKGNYILKVQFISYNSQFLSVTIGDADRQVNLGNIVLNPDTETLDEVVVTGAKDQMQLELDKRVFNVAENIANIGANASEILDQIPSVAVDVEGNVSLRGSNNVRILVNGKPSGLVGINNQDGLRQLQGGLIERIEVVTNPSARYDAEGSAGIINIILKKEKQGGFNGAFTANIGYPYNYGFSGNANYRTGKFNLFASYGINYRENPGGGYTDRTSFGTDTLFTYINNDRVRSGLAHNVRIGTDFYFNEKNILTASGLVRISDEENISELSYLDRNSQRQLIGNTLRKDTEIEDDNNFEYQLNYQRQFEGKGHELNTQVQYRNNDETEDSSIGQADLQMGESLAEYQRSLNVQGDKSILMQVDYVYPFSDGKKFETGYRGTIREITSDYEVKERDSTGQFVPIEEVFEGLNLSNRFEYDEDVHAAYAIFENKMDKWGYQLGVRFEQTYITTYQREGDVKVDKEYLNAFPSAFISYNLSKARTLQASYSRRISRPRFWLLNPFYSFTDPRNIRRGNTNVDPAYTDSYEFGVLNNLDNASIYFGAYYRYTTGVIERIDVAGTFAGQPATISTPYNIGVEDAFGLEANFSYDPVKWLNVNGNANFYRAMTNGSYEGQVLDRDALTANFRLNSRIKLGTVDIQVSGNYRAPENTVQGTRKSFYSMDLGANTDVFDDKGTITLSVRDVFNSRKWRGTLDTPTLVEESEFQWRARQITLSFTYRVNQKKPRRSRREGGDFDGSDDF